MRTARFYVGRQPRRIPLPTLFSTPKDIPLSSPYLVYPWSSQCHGGRFVSPLGMGRLTTAPPFQHYLPSGPAVAALSLVVQNELSRALGAVETAMQSRVCRGRQHSAAVYNRIWDTFCQQYELDPTFTTTPDPIPWLQVFADGVRTGRISASGHRVRSGTVADALCFVSQTYTLFGKQDP
jgi:hypothetical protein